MFMRVFQVLATTTAGAWLGGMILIAIVAQTTFSQMREVDVDRPNAIAGRIMAVNFSRFDTMQMVCAAVLVLWQTARLLSARRHVGDWLRTVAILAAVGLLAYSSQVLTPRILSLQNAVAGPDAEAHARALFDEFHRGAVLISKINLVLVAGIVFTLAWRSGAGRHIDAGQSPTPVGNREGTS
jgi:hypothetical protein